MDKDILRTVLKIGVPSAIQIALISALLPIIDMIMVSNLGEGAISAIGSGSKIMLLVSSVMTSIATLTGIMVAQYVGNQDTDSINHSVSLNMSAALLAGGGLMAICLLFPTEIMHLFTDNTETVNAGVEYLTIISFSFIPIAIQNITASIMRCYEKAIPLLVTSSITTVTNVILNYLLITGKYGFPALGIKGAALASAIASMVGCILLVAYYYYKREDKPHLIPIKFKMPKKFLSGYFNMLIGIFFTGILFSLAENVYAAMYGHMDIDSYSAYCILSSMMGAAFCLILGLQASASVIVGRYMGHGDFDKAYSSSKELMVYALVIAIIVSILIVIFREPIIGMFNIESGEAHEKLKGLMLVFVFVFPVMSLNSVISNSILKAGGRVYIPLMIDIIGMWFIGVTTAVLCVTVLKMDVITTYMLVSLEQIVRLALCFVVFHRKKFIRKIEVLSATT